MSELIQSPKVFLIRELESVQILDEVLVSAHKNYLRSSSDTLTYQAQDLRNNNTVTIEDLIRNIPGITIDKISGTIKYKNREIENILIDGDNVTGKNYQVISQSLNERVAKSLQIIEGYTENEVLKNFKRDDKVAVNLKTDEKYRNQINGNIDVGYGYKDRYDLKSNLFLISEGLKNITTASYNNFGNFSLGNIISSRLFVKNQLPLLNFNELDNVYLLPVYNKNLQLSLINTANILENNDFSISSNQTTNFDEKNSLTLNVTFYNDDISTAITEDISFLIPEDAIHINNHTESLLKNRNFDFSLDFRHERNEWSNLAIRAQFKNRQKRNFDHGNVSGEDYRVESKINIPEIRFMFDYSVNINSKAALVLFNESTISQIDEDVNFFGHQFYNIPNYTEETTILNFQNINRKSYKNILGLNYAYKISTNSILTSGLVYTDYKVISDNNWELNNNNTSFAEKHSIKYYAPQLHWALYRKNATFSLLFKTSIIDRGNQQKSDFEITPSFFYRYKTKTSRFNDINFEVNAGRGLVFYDFYKRSNLVYFNDINYLFLDNQTDLYYTSNHMRMATLYGFYKSRIELTGDINFSINEKPLINSYTFSENFYFNEVLSQKNQHQSLQLKFGIKKYFPNFNTRLEFLPEYGYNNWASIINQAYIKNTSIYSRLRLNAGIVVAQNFQVSIGCNYLNVKNSQEDSQNDKIQNYYDNFSLYFNTGLSLLDSKVNLQFENEYIDYFNTEKLIYSSLSVKYRPEKSKIELRLNLKNIFNHSIYSNRQFTEVYQYEKQTRLLPRSCVFSINYIF